jgi:Domain of unknown function (DUF4173)
MLNKFLSRGGANIKAALTGSLLFGLVVAIIDWRLNLGWFWAFILLIPILTLDIINLAQKTKLNWQADVYRGLAMLGCFGLALAGGTAVVAPSFVLYLAGLTLYSLAVRTDGTLKVGKYFIYPFEALVSYFTVLGASLPFIKNIIPKVTNKKLTDRGKSFIRGALITFPLLLIFGLLLASSDPIFAKLFRLPFDLPSWNLANTYKFVVTLAFFSSLVFAVCAVAVRQKREEFTIEDKLKFGITEAKIVGWSIAALFGLFILVQFRYMFMGYKDVIQGYTYSDYARRGFVELIVVSLMSLAVVRYFKTKLQADNSKVKTLNLVIGLEMLVLAASSLKRLSLYEQAYGLTTLRLFVITVVVWLAGVWIINSVLNLNLRQVKDSSLAGYAGAWLGVVLLVYILLSPGQYVLKHNFARYRSTGKIDSCYQKQIASESAEAYRTLNGEMEKSGLGLAELDKMPRESNDGQGSTRCFYYVSEDTSNDDLLYSAVKVDAGYKSAQKNNVFEHTLRSYLATH